MKIKSIVITLVVLAGVGALVAHRLNTDNDATSKKAPDPAVSLSLTEPKNVPFLIDLNGTVTSLKTVDVHAQVTNLVREVRVHEGQFVQAGDVLFVLDDRVDKANYNKLYAQLLRDKSLAVDQDRQLLRNEELKQKNFVSQGALDTSHAQRDAQVELVKSDEAALEAARVALEFDTIRAPISGRTGVVNVFPGSLVVPQTTSLVTITQLDPISVQFSVPEAQLAKLQLALAHSNSKAGEDNVQVKAPGASNSLSGQLYFVDNTVDPTSGNIKAKAMFSNSKNELWPGEFVQTTLNFGVLKDALSVPAKALVNSPNGKFVYVVGEDNVAIRKNITEVYLFGESMVVEGLMPGDRVVVDGKQNVRPNATVRVVNLDGKAPAGNKEAAKDGAKDSSRDSASAQAKDPGKSSPAAQ
jgi:RND family efflux transporter MFP subunit